MLIDYDPFIDRVIQKYEGPYGWNKSDPGGPTKYGITCFDLAEHMGQKMDSMSRWAPIVQAMTLAVAEQIYATKYATAISFNSLPAGVDCVVLDYAINSGIGRGRLMLTEFATNITAHPDVAINAICDERLRFMHAIRGGSAWVEFGHGWGTRVADLRAYALHLAAGGSHVTAPVATDLSNVVTPKAIHAPKTATKTTIVAAGGAIAAAHTAGLPIWGVGLVAVGVVIAGTTYEALSEQSAAAANLKVA
jgi:lysozyme family protein